MASTSSWSKTPREACVRVLQIHPDIIVADLTTPNHESRQFLENLKQNPGTRDIPIVTMSALFSNQGTNESGTFLGIASWFR